MTACRQRAYTQAEMLAMGSDGHLGRAFMRYIPLERLDGLEPVPSNNESDDGQYHSGKPITQPIEVQYDQDLDVYMVFGGNHRIAQARANGQTHILAFVEPDRSMGRDYIGLWPKIEDPDVEPRAKNAIEALAYVADTERKKSAHLTASVR